MERFGFKKISPITELQAAIGAAAMLAFFVLWALIAAVGDDFVCWIGGKDNLSGWVQALGVFLAIGFSGFLVAHQLRHAELHQLKIQRDAELASLWGCLFAANDAIRAMYDLSRKISGERERPPDSSRERIEGLEETFRILLASKPPAGAVTLLLSIMAELAYSRVAIREFKKDGDNSAQILKSEIRLRKVQRARDDMADMYKFLEGPKDPSTLKKDLAGGR